MADRPEEQAAVVRLDPLLLEVLACPACHGGLDLNGAELVCSSCALAYPVRDDVPVLLVDEARPSAGPEGDA